MDGINFTNKAQRMVMQAQNLAREMGQQNIDALHLLFVMISADDNIVVGVLNKLNVDIPDLQKKVRNAITKIPSVTGSQPLGQFYLTEDMVKVMDRAKEEALNMNDEFVSIDHLFLSILAVKSLAGDILAKVSYLKVFNPDEAKEILDYTSAAKIIQQMRGGERITSPNPEARQRVLENYSRNLTNLAKKGKLDPVVGREDEIRRLMQILSRRTKNNPVLIGEPGVGKTAIVEGFSSKNRPGRSSGKLERQGSHQS